LMPTSRPSESYDQQRYVPSASVLQPPLDPPELGGGAPTFGMGMGATGATPSQLHVDPLPVGFPSFFCTASCDESTSELSALAPLHANVKEARERPRTERRSVGAVGRCMAFLFFKSEAIAKALFYRAFPSWASVPLRAGTTCPARGLRAIHAAGYLLRPRPHRAVALLLPPAAGEESAILALLRSGESWTTSALAIALGTAQRTVQRALVALAERGQVEHTVLTTIQSTRFVTGVTFVDGELWHGTWKGDERDLRRVEPASGEVLDVLEMPAGTGVSGLESNGKDLLFCGGGKAKKVVRAIRRPKRGTSCARREPRAR